LAEVDLSCFIDGFYIKTDFVFDIEAFILALTCFICLSSDHLSDMIYELLWDCFVFDKFACGFDFIFFEICKYITRGDVPPLVSHLLVALRLLALEKQFGGV
jgi:hypothetical protein